MGRLPLVTKVFLTAHDSSFLRLQLATHSVPGLPLGAKKKSKLGHPEQELLGEAGTAKEGRDNDAPVLG